MPTKKTSKVKTYVLDTNVLLHNPNAIFSFEDNHVVLPDVVLDELDKHKNDKYETGANAREVARILERIRNDPSNGNLLDGYKLPSGGTLRIEMNHVDTKMPELWENCPDLRILRVCKGIIESGTNAILVSNDNYVKIKASALGMQAQDFTTERTPNADELFTGRREGLIDDESMKAFYQNKGVEENKIVYYGEDGEEVEMPPLKLHEYILLKNFSGTSSALAFFDGKEVVPLRDEKLCPFGIIPRNVGQKMLVDALSRDADEAPLVIGKGPAGTGKTLLALAVGLDAVIDDEKYEKILYLRGNTKLDEDIGFLPGDEKEKLDWVLRPVRDNMKILFTQKKEKDEKTTRKNSRRKEYMGSDYDFKTMSDEQVIQDIISETFERGYVDVEAVAHMRGRSIDSTFVIIDEAQNLTPKQIRTLLSRCAENTKIVLLGDPDQIDHPYLDYRTNGLCYSADRMMGDETTWQMTFTKEECVRSKLSIAVAERMNDKG